MIVNAFPENLYLTDLPQPRTGFRNFISSWFFTEAGGRRVLVDPGPACTIPLLLETLSRMTDAVDIVLLTHVHLDHSGGVTQFLEAYPDAKVRVHPKGKKHLLDPGKLWKASLETLGDLAAAYGEPLPLPPQALADDNEKETGPDAIGVLETPGHAPHHLCFTATLQGGEKLFFVGEAAGLCLPPCLFLPSTSEQPYLRPTTPPRFDIAAARESLEKIEAALQGDELLCYSHWGAARNPRRMIALARRQLDDWLDVIARMEGRSEEDIFARLLEVDPLLSGASRLPEDLRKRELIFIKNSIRGLRRACSDAC